MRYLVLLLLLCGCAQPVTWCEERELVYVGDDTFRPRWRSSTGKRSFTRPAHAVPYCELNCSERALLERFQ